MAMNDIWNRWAEHYKRLGIDPMRICKDGIIDEASFRKSSHRILLVIRETPRWPHGDIRELFRITKPCRKITRWAEVAFDKFPECSAEKEAHPELLRGYLTEVAVINLKKTSDDSKSDALVINAYAHQDRDLLSEQLDSIKPNLIIACDTIDILIWLMDIDVNPDTLLRGAIRDKRRNIKILPVTMVEYSKHKIEEMERQ